MADEPVSVRPVVVTGASGRLGRVVVEKFHQTGHRVVGIDLDTPSGDEIPVYEADVTSEQEVEDVFSTLVSEHGTPSVLVHTVGMWAAEPVVTLTASDWDTIMNVNLRSTFLCFREALRHMSDADADGRLIAFASGQGADRAAAEQSAYSAAKAAVIRLVEAVAFEQEGTGRTAHAIAPSMILFEGMEDQDGIPAADLANICLVLAGPAGQTLSGLTIRAYGTLR